MKKIYLLLTAILLWPVLTFAQNGDSCSVAVEITADGTYDVEGFTGTGAEGSGATAAAWFFYTPTEGGTINVSSCAGAGGEDTRLYIYEGSCAALTSVDDDDDGCDSPNGAASVLLDLPVVSGTTYYIEWNDRWDELAFTFDFSFVATPTCDDISGLVISETTETTVTFNWNDDANTSWDYAVDVTGFDVSLATPVNVTDTFATASSLTSGLFYDLYVRTNCGSEFGVWEMLTFKTIGEGDNCDVPIMVDFDADLPYADSNQTNCGRGNTYDATCLGSYDGGEDIVYEFTLTGTMDVELTFDPDGTTWVGVGIFSSCPDADNCVITETQYSSDIITLSTQLAAGTYYFMASTYPSPNCIPNFHLNISAEIVLCGDVTDLAVSDYTVDGATFSWNGDGNTDWEYAYGPTGFDIDTATLTATTDTFLVATGFLPDVVYDFYVRTDCGLEVGSWFIESAALIPSYDEICGASEIVVDGDTVIVDNTFATWGEDSASCWFNYNSGDVWLEFTFTPTADYNAIEIGTGVGTSDDSQLALYSSDSDCSGVLTEIGCSDDIGFPNFMSYIGPVILEAGTYYIQASTYSDVTGNFGVVVNSLLISEPPVNDNCDGATVVDLEIGTPVTVTGNGDGATLGAFTAAQVWEAFTLTECANVTLDFCGSATQASALFGSVYDCPVTAALAAGDIVLIECTGDSALSVVFTGLEAGTYYYPVVADTAAFGGFHEYTLNMTAVACDPPIAEEGESFEGETFVPVCWTSIDADGDGNDWFQYGFDGTAYAGLNSAASASWTSADGALNPDNYLVSPQMILGDDEVLNYKVGAQDPSYPQEKYGVYISTAGNDEADFTTELFVETLEDGEWYDRTVDLSDYNGMTVYLAFRHYDVSDMFYMKLDNIILPGTYADCITGIAEVEEQEFSIYPNPNNGQFNIVNNGQEGRYIIQLMDVTGKVVYSESIELNANARTQINTSDLNTGVYLVRMTNTEDNYYRTIRMIIK